MFHLQNNFVIDVIRKKTLDSSMNKCELIPYVLTDDKPLLEELKLKTNIEARNAIRGELKKRERLTKKK